MNIFSPSVLTAISRFAGSNGSPITVPLALTTLFTLDLGQCVAGQIIIATAQIYMTKGATLGDTDLFIRKTSGTGTLLFNNNNPFTQERINNQAAGSQCGMTLTSFGIVTASGTILLSVSGDSTGSDGSIAAGGIAMSAIRFNR